MTPQRVKLLLNLYPPFLGAGVKIVSISDDWKNTTVTMPLRWYNRNAVGTQFGGSLYSMVDPHLMLMMMGILGENYLVWDKSATIEFLRPGKGRVTSHLEISDLKLEQIQSELGGKKKVTPSFEVAVMDGSGKKVAQVMKQLYIRRKH